MLDTLLTIIFALAAFGLLCAPLVPGPYGAGIRAFTACDSAAKFGYALFAGMICGMLAIHILASKGLL